MMNMTDTRTHEGGDRGSIDMRILVVAVRIDTSSHTRVSTIGTCNEN